MAVAPRRLMQSVFFYVFGDGDLSSGVGVRSVEAAAHRQGWSFFVLWRVMGGGGRGRSLRTIHRTITWHGILLGIRYHVITTV